MNPEPGGTPLNVVGWPARVIRLARSLSVDEHSVKKQRYFFFLCLLAFDQLHTSGCLTNVGVCLLWWFAGGRASGRPLSRALATLLLLLLLLCVVG